MDLKQAINIFLANSHGLCVNCKDPKFDCDGCQEAQIVLKGYAQTGIYDCDECAYMYIRGDEICCSRADGGKECEFAEIASDEEV